MSSTSPNLKVLILTVYGGSYLWLIRTMCGLYPLFSRHSLFLKMISNGEEGTQVPGTEGIVAKKSDLPQGLNQVRDLPVFREASFLSLESH